MIDEHKLHDYMKTRKENLGKKLYPKLVRHAQSYIDSIAGDHVYNGDDYDDRISHSKNLDRAQAKGMMVPGRDHVVHAHAEIAADHLHRKFEKHPGFTHDLAYKAALHAGGNIWGHNEPEESEKHHNYKKIDAARARARAGKPKRQPKPPKAVHPWNNAGFKTKVYKPPIRGTGSYGSAKYSVKEDLDEMATHKVTIHTMDHQGRKASIDLDVPAENKEEAKEKALNHVKQHMHPGMSILEADGWEPKNAFKPGDKVYHPKNGAGTVRQINTNGQVVVDHKKFKSRLAMSRYTSDDKNPHPVQTYNPSSLLHRYISKKRIDEELNMEEEYKYLHPKTRHIPMELHSVVRERVKKHIDKLNAEEKAKGSPIRHGVRIHYIGPRPGRVGGFRTRYSSRPASTRRQDAHSFVVAHHTKDTSTRYGRDSKWHGERQGYIHAEDLGVHLKKNKALQSYGHIQKEDVYRGPIPLNPGAQWSERQIPLGEGKQKTQADYEREAKRKQAYADRTKNNPAYANLTPKQKRDLLKESPGYVVHTHATNPISQVRARYTSVYHAGSPEDAAKQALADHQQRGHMNIKVKVQDK